MITRYHVFTSEELGPGTDDWYATWEEAEAAFTASEAPRKRLFIEQYQDEDGLENDELLHEDCLKSVGQYPW
jgi:hypothetical protein